MEDSRWCVAYIHDYYRSRDLYCCIIVFFFLFMLLLYILDQTVDLFLLKLFVNCLYRMNCNNLCAYIVWITIRLFFFFI
jgi:hypothetical protein